ncbi:MAG: sigma-70 family RNA polymerase sigma factor [Planctomycetota bacterium]
MNPFVPPDQELLRRLARGDEAAFEQLYARHRVFVLSIARRYTQQEEDALDVMQEVFSWLIRRAGSIDLRAKLTTLLFPVIRHQAIDLLRRRRRRAETTAGSFDQEGESGFLDQFPAPPQRPEPGSSREALAEVLARLPSAQREVLLLRFVDGLELDEIAAALAVPAGTVKSRLHYALAQLREDPFTRRYFEKKESSNPQDNLDPGESL